MHFKHCFQGTGNGNCRFISGEYTFTQEQYLQKTDSAAGCVQEVKARAENADAMTWTMNTKDCWAKYGSSNSSIDPNGCSYCQSCFFSKTINYSYQNIGNRYNMNFETK